jgi:hypothetical protein
VLQQTHQSCDIADRCPLASKPESYSCKVSDLFVDALLWAFMLQQRYVLVRCCDHVVNVRHTQISAVYHNLHSVVQYSTYKQCVCSSSHSNCGDEMKCCSGCVIVLQQWTVFVNSHIL